MELKITTNRIHRTCHKLRASVWVWQCSSVWVCESASVWVEWQFPREVSSSSHSSTSPTTQVAQKAQLDKWRKGHQSWSQGFFWPLCQLISIYFCQRAGSWEEGSLGARRSEALKDLQPIVSFGEDFRSRSYLSEEISLWPMLKVRGAGKP